MNTLIEPNTVKRPFVNSSRHYSVFNIQNMAIMIRVLLFHNLNKVIRHMNNDNYVFSYNRITTLIHLYII